VFAFFGVVTTNLIATNSHNAPDLSNEERRRRRDHSGNMLAQVSGRSLSALTPTDQEEGRERRQRAVGSKRSIATGCNPVTTECEFKCDAVLIWPREILRQ
jgi:hypothetical protein